MKSVVIIGASHAAAEAVSTLRKKGWEGRICLVGEEPFLPYQRPPLSKAYYKGELELDRLIIRGESFYLDNNVELYLGRRAVHIDRDKNVVELDNDELLHYDKLILATGTRPRTLSISGSNLVNTYYLRTKNDVDEIKKNVTPGSKLLIVGAGYIGLEIAASAVKQGVGVILIEAEKRVLARVTSPEISSFYQALHISEGVDLKVGAQLVEFTKHHEVSSAVLASGEVINFDNAIIGIGVIPNVELAENSGLACDNGIKVNEYCQTDDPNIYAVGDCSNHPNLIYGRRIRLESVPNATGQAKTAALSICGELVAYDQVPWFWSDQFDVKLQTAGLLQGYDSVGIRGEISDRKFSVFYFQGQSLLAVDAVNSPAEFMLAKKWIADKQGLDPKKVADTSVPIKELAA